METTYLLIQRENIFPLILEAFKKNYVDVQEINKRFASLDSL